MDAQYKAVLQYENAKKSLALTYLLWAFAGGIGAHRFYTQRTGSAVAMLLLTIASLPLTFMVGPIGFGIVMLWGLVDAFLIPGWIREYNNRLLDAV
jgi:TM2 domain-containing membrane protein YozV